MNNDYSNNDQGEGAGAKASAANWFQKTRIYKTITNPMFIVCLILFIGIIVVIYWNYICPRQFKTFYKKLLQFAGFKYSHLTNQEIKESHEATRSSAKDVREAPLTNSHIIIYGSSSSGKTSFLKHYLTHTPRTPDSGKLSRSLCKGCSSNREGKLSQKIFLTINNPYNFFDSIVQTYAIAPTVKDGLNWKYYRDQLEYGIIELDTRSQKYKVLNNKSIINYDSSKRSKWGPEQLVAYESYFFTGDEYNRLKIVLEEMSDQTIEITPLNIA